MIRYWLEEALCAVVYAGGFIYGFARQVARYYWRQLSGLGGWQ